MIHLKRKVLTLAVVAGALAATLSCAFSFASRRPHPPAGRAVPEVAAGIRFRETSAQSGLIFRWHEKPHRPLRAFDAVGEGCGFIDYDDDGDQDILLVNEPTVGLFRNDGHGSFVDVTEQLGLRRVRGQWKGCAVGDFDGDGRRDIVLTGFHCLCLLRNIEGRSFMDVTASAGLDPKNWDDWSTSAGFMDLDRDGDLDLLVQNYVIWGPGVREYCSYNGILMGCPPKVYEPEFGRLFRNDGKGHFTDVSQHAGFKALTGIGLVIGFADADDDGLIDIYLGNDAVDANFMKNLGDLRFKDVALLNGTVYSAASKPMAAMGVDWADYDRDGDMDFAVTDFSHASYAVYRNEHGLFTDVAAQVGIAAPTYDPLGFGTKFVDVDNDGWPELFFCNGHVYDRVAESNPPLTFRQPPMLFRNLAGKRFEDLVPILGGDLARPFIGRGSATGDVDNDGRMDLLAVDLEGTPVLLRNESDTGNHWVTLDLRGKAPNHFAYGARVKVVSGQETWAADVSPTSSYQSSSDPRVHLGLGKATHIDRIEVRWSTGARQEFRDLPVDRILQIRQDGATPVSLAPQRSERPRSGVG